MNPQLRPSRKRRAYLIVVEISDGYFIGGVSSQSALGLDLASLAHVPATTFEHAFEYLDR